MTDKRIGWAGRPVSWQRFSSLGLPFEYHIFWGWSLVFGSYWLIVTWCIVLLLHPLPSVLLDLFVHLPFSFSASWLCHESWGGVSITVDTLNTLGSLFSSISPYRLVRDSGM
jgi:hypothetical protein